MKTGGAYYSNGQCTFHVWAPEKKRMVLHIVEPVTLTIEMEPANGGYFFAQINDIDPNARYFFKPDGETDFPDPAANFQPLGVHGPSQIVDHQSYEWHDADWKGALLEDLILYEIHVGTFTSAGTFEAVIPLLDDLVDTGVNAIELMPIGEFPGDRNWGYDTVFPYSVHHAYGGPIGLKKLVDACHKKGIAVFLDVVYNHLGPEGNYFSCYGPYFTKKYHTPWGDALNFDGEWSDGVREYFSNNSLFWFEYYHIDGLRCDAIHEMFDSGAVHFWELLYNSTTKLAARLGRQLHLIAESDLNSPKVVKHPDCGGWGFSAQWLDDFHHALYVILDPKGKERYEDFGALAQLAKAYTDGFVHSGSYVKFRKRRYGSSSAGIKGDKFIVFNQNHDQVGNRVGGERLSCLMGFEQLKVAAAAMLLSPYIPMLFMGEEYGETAPFFYFVSHSEKALIELVRTGRKNEFAQYNGQIEPPDAQSKTTFEQSKLNWHLRDANSHALLHNWYKALIRLRKTKSALKNFDKNGIMANIQGSNILSLIRTSDTGLAQLYCIFNLGNELGYYTFPEGSQFVKVLDSTLEQSYPSQTVANVELSVLPWSIVVYELIKV